LISWASLTGEAETKQKRVASRDEESRQLLRFEKAVERAAGRACGLGNRYWKAKMGQAGRG
jgi:hypothetical protein